MKTELWIPFAKKAPFEMKTKGKYAKNHPIGAVVHFTAGNSLEDGGFNSMTYGRDMGYAFLCILRDGTLWQANPLDEWGYHAGESKWDGINGGVSDDLVGIEICSAGRLTILDGKYYPWFAFANNKLVRPELAIPEDEVRIVPSPEPAYAPQAWHKFTNAQEDTLKRLLVFLAQNAPTVFKPQFVLGHDEVSPKRKNDPGKSLSCSMPELRKWLAETIAKTGEGNPQDDTVTWLELHRLDENGATFTGCVAYDGGIPRASWAGTDTRALIVFMRRFQKANTILVAPNSKSWPGSV